MKLTQFSELSNTFSRDFNSYFKEENLNFVQKQTVQLSFSKKNSSHIGR